MKKCAQFRLLLSITVLLTFIDTVFAGERLCDLRYDKRAWGPWYDFGSGIVYGLYEEPPATP